jgi:Leucine-rich repeat (LRR) protein
MLTCPKLHQNKLTSLPDSICDIMPLTNLDLSHNELTSIPENLFSLPELINLNVSHNKLVSLPFNAPFMGDGSIRRVSTNFFSVTVERASSPSPRLQTLEASNNLINASSIHLRIPASVAKLDLSSNPLDGDGDNVSCQKLVAALGSLTKLTELRMERADISDEAFPASLSSSAIFPSLRLFDLSETKVTVDSAKAAFGGMKQTLDYDYTTEEPPAGVCRIIVGKKMLKEAWEIEVEKQAKHRSLKARDAEHEVSTPASPHSSMSVSQTRKEAPKEVVKESWEIEAEKGMLTEGGKRRARAAAAAGEHKVLGHGKTPSTVSTTSSPSPTPGQSQSTFSLSSPKYYAESTLTLTLPPCTPASKAAGHHRAFSLATAPLMAPAPTTDIAVPIPTLPLSVIVAQPFSNSLRTLILTNRRMDRCFALPGGPMEENLLPNLEELDLENCNLPDTIAVSRGNSSSRTNEPIIPLITKLFHNLQTLNMSYNALAGGLRDTEALSSLILARGGRRGLKHLRLRGNGIKDLDGLQGVASMFKGFREVPGWKLDEVDIRDNNVEKLPPELGLLPLDVFLVDGNV